MRRSLQQDPDQQQDPDPQQGLQGGALVAVISAAVLSVLLLAVIAHRIHRNARWWAARARQAQALNEIELDFVDELDEDAPHSTNVDTFMRQRCHTHAPCFHERLPPRRPDTMGRLC